MSDLTTITVDKETHRKIKVIVAIKNDKIGTYIKEYVDMEYKKLNIKNTGE